MATVVLVHGSFHGGWCWTKLEPLLRQEGHDVYTPTLTGLGDRSHLLDRNTGLHLHVQDVIQLLEYENLEDVVLVGHSYGGLVITGVAEACRDRLAELVYLDGYLAHHGETAWDLTPDGQTVWETMAVPAGDPWLVPPPDPVESYGVTDPDDIAWLRERLVPTTLLTHEEPVHAPTGRERELPRTFIRCAEYDAFAGMHARAESEDVPVHILETGHDAMVTAPSELADILIDIAEA